MKTNYPPLAATALYLNCLCAEDNYEMVDYVMNHRSDEELDLLFSGTPRSGGYLTSKQKSAIGEQRYLYWNYIKEVRDRIISDEDDEVLECYEEMSEYARKCLFGLLNDEETKRLEELI